MSDSKLQRLRRELAQDRTQPAIEALARELERIGDQKGLCELGYHRLTVWWTKFKLGGWCRQCRRSITSLGPRIAFPSIENVTTQRVVIAGQPVPTGDLDHSQGSFHWATP